MKVADANVHEIKCFEINSEMGRKNFWNMSWLAPLKATERYREISFENPLVFQSLQKSPAVVNIHSAEGVALAPPYDKGFT